VDYRQKCRIFTWPLVKSRNGQIWKFLFEGLVHSPSFKHKLLGLEPRPPNASIVPIFTIFKANLQKYVWLLWLRTNGKYLFGFCLPQPSKFAVEFSSPGKWSPFEKYLPVTWNAPSFDRIFLGFPSIKLNGLFTKTKEAKTSNVDRV
jgi:hypothetical protein